MSGNSQNDIYAGSGRTAVAEPPNSGGRFVEERVRLPVPPELEDIRVGHEPETRRRQGVSIPAIFGFALAFSMLALTLLAQIHLTGIINETRALEARLEELESERKTLIARFESAVDLEKIEYMAIHELGMERGDGKRAHSGEEADVAVVFDNENIKPEPSIAEKLKVFAGSFREYFKGVWSYN